MLINDVRTFGSKSDDTRIQIQGVNPLGRDLGAPTVAPKCTIVFLFFSFPFGYVFAYLFNSFHDLECKFTDPRAQISTYMKKDPFLRNKMQPIWKMGSKSNSWDLVWVAPKCFSTLFLFFSSLVIFLCILVMPFVRFRTRSYRSEGPDINLYEEEPEFERQNARMTENGVETQLLGLGCNCICAQVLFCTFLFQVRTFLNEDDMDARSILITSLGWWKWRRSITYEWS